jgi:hypothetical protein
MGRLISASALAAPASLSRNILVRSEARRRSTQARAGGREGEREKDENKEEAGNMAGGGRG